MIKLKNAYTEARDKAIDLMHQGRISAYIAQLARVNELRLQMMNIANLRR